MPRTGRVMAARTLAVTESLSNVGARASDKGRRIRDWLSSGAVAGVEETGVAAIGFPRSTRLLPKKLSMIS